MQKRLFPRLSDRIDGLHGVGKPGENRDSDRAGKPEKRGKLTGVVSRVVYDQGYPPPLDRRHHTLPNGHCRRLFPNRGRGLLPHRSGITGATAGFSPTGAAGCTGALSPETRSAPLFSVSGSRIAAAPPAGSGPGSGRVSNAGFPAGSVRSGGSIGGGPGFSSRGRAVSGSTGYPEGADPAGGRYGFSGIRNRMTERSTPMAASRKTAFRDADLPRAFLRPVVPGRGPAVPPRPARSIICLSCPLLTCWRVGRNHGLVKLLIRHTPAEPVRLP